MILYAGISFFVSALGAWLGLMWAAKHGSGIDKAMWTYVVPTLCGVLSALLIAILADEQATLLVFTICLFFGLSLVAAADCQSGLIPDIAVIGLAILALIGLAVLKLQAWPLFILGAILGAGLLWSLRVLYKRARGLYGLGLGDVKLMAVCGGLLGPFYVGYAIALGAAATLFWLMIFKRDALKTGQLKIPFGPGLCFGIGALWVYQIRGGQYGTI